MNDYRKEIDVLRAVAVLAVVFYHAKFRFYNIEFFEGGYLGVDIFFVISGYLISRNLFKEYINTNSINFKSFYLRRVKRLAPIFFTVITIFYFVAFIYYSPWGFLNFSKSVISSIFFLSNYYFSQISTVYGSEDSLYIPFLHTWSLSVEEQFYLIFPTLFFLIFKFRKKNILVITCIIIFISFIFSVYFQTTHPQLNFYNFFSRIWEILTGSVIAYFEIFKNKFYIKISRQNLFNSMARISYLGLFLCFLFFNEDTAHPGALTALPIVFTSLIIINRKKNSKFYKLIENKYFVYLGLISYSLYLWHYPLFSFTRLYFRRAEILLTNEIKIFLIFLSIIISFFSYKLIEKPLRYSKKMTSIWIYSILLITVSAMSYRTQGFEEAMSNFKYKDSLSAYNLISQQLNTSLYDNMTTNECKYWSASIDQAFIDKLNFCTNKYQDTILILGDSHAMNLYNIFALSDKYNSVIGLSQGFCRPHGCEAGIKNHYEDFQKLTNKIDKTKIKIIYHQSGSHLIKDENGINESEEIFISGKYYFDEESTKEVIKYLENLYKSNLEVLWIGPFPEFRYKLEDVIEDQSKWEINPVSNEVFNNLEKFLIASVENSSFKYIAFGDIFEYSKNAFINVDGTQCFQFIDEDHFSKCGEINLSKNIKDF